MEKQLSRKVAIITGAGRGIGVACARLFVARGAKVVIVSRTEAELKQVETELVASYGTGHVHTVVADVSEEASVKHLFSEAEKAFGLVDILVNNAGAITVCPFSQMTSAVWDKVIGVNLRGTFLCSREAFHQMERSKRGGAIVNLSSLGGVRGTQKFEGFSAYVAAKFGVVGLTESLAVEGKKFGIRVNCVAPGAVDTRMLKEAAPFLSTRTTPEHVAEVIGFLCDEKQSSSVNGAVIEIHSNE